MYVEDKAIECEGRKEFRGYALTPKEAERLCLEVHRTAFNVTIAARVSSASRHAQG